MENVSHLQKLVFFSAFLWRDLWTQISAVRCASYIAVASIRVELSEGKVCDKKKNKKKHQKIKTIRDFATRRFRTLAMVLAHDGV